MADPNKAPLPPPATYVKKALNGREKSIDDAVDEAITGNPPAQPASPPVPKQNQSTDHQNGY